MARLVVELILLGLACCAYARKCNPDEGVEPSPCDPSSCALPDCACEGSEPSVPLADRPQVHQAIALFITRLSHIMFLKRLYGFILSIAFEKDDFQSSISYLAGMVLGKSPNSPFQDGGSSPRGSRVTVFSSPLGEVR